MKIKKSSFIGNQIINYFLSADIPWQFRILVIMVIIFFLGGVFLDYQASQIDITSVIDQMAPEQNQIALDWVNQKAERLTSSAKLLYDFAKIALGALIASITRIKSRDQKDLEREDRKLCIATEGTEITEKNNSKLKGPDS
ncbi:MAG: hypothetical protein ACYS1A_05375 [Planctomycetota bacterium]|jgi:hypothetical protein